MGKKCKLVFFWYSSVVESPSNGTRFSGKKFALCSTNSWSNFVLKIIRNSERFAQKSVSLLYHANFTCKVFSDIIIYAIQLFHMYPVKIDQIQK